MPLLIDGDNLLGTWPGRKRSDAERRKLAFELSRFAQRLRRRVVVVFDGTAPPGENVSADVHYAGPARTADELILDLLRQQANPRGWNVVTSDRSLGDQSRYLRATVERSDRFRKRLLQNATSEKPTDETDVDYWLEQFGPETED